MTAPTTIPEAASILRSFVVPLFRDPPTTDWRRGYRAALVTAIALLEGDDPREVEASFRARWYQEQARAAAQVVTDDSTPPQSLVGLAAELMGMTDGQLERYAFGDASSLAATLESDLERMTTAVVDPALSLEERRAVIRGLSEERRRLRGEAS